MRKNFVFTVILMVALTSALYASVNIQRVTASETVYIRSDGSIDPPTANITSLDNVTYTFTGDINDSLVVQRSNVIIDGGGYTLQGTGGAVGLDVWENTTVKNMVITSFYYGIRLSNAFNITVSGIHVEDCTNGISFGEASNNTISGNVISNNRYGIEADAVASTVFCGNDIVNNTEGFYLYYATDNIFYENNITQNEVGAYVDYNSYNNTFYHNNFTDNINQAEIDPTYTNMWDNGFEGNYWSNYTHTDVDPRDGIGDSPHTIGANNIDNHPLMGPFHGLTTAQGKRVHVVTNSTVDSFTHFPSNNTIVMYASNMTTEQTTGFCRITVPHELIDTDNITVIIDDGLINVLHLNVTVYDNGTHRWIYFAYQHTTREIVIVPESSMLLLLPLFMLATLLTTAAYRRKHT